MERRDKEIKALIIIVMLSLSLLMTGSIWDLIAENHLLNGTRPFVIQAFLFSVSLTVIKIILKLVIKFLDKHGQ